MCCYLSNPKYNFWEDISKISFKLNDENLRWGLPAYIKNPLQHTFLKQH